MRSIFVNVCLNGVCLRTIEVFEAKSSGPDMYAINNLNPATHFPDVPELALEDIDGNKYKRVYPKFNYPDWLYFAPSL